MNDAALAFYAAQGPMSRLRYQSDGRLRVPANIFTMVDGKPAPATVAVD
jgi:hypothetical protein